MRKHDLWRTRLDPRDPDYLDPVPDCNDEDWEPTDYTDAELDEAASDAENRWRNEP
jgi:hypothetical protein